MNPEESIEILPVSLLDLHRPLVTELKQLARSLGRGLGWHYLLDLTWIIDQLGEVRGKRILDAGAGVGVLQWYLAGYGAQVVSVDRASRAQLPLHFRLRYRVTGLRSQDLAPVSRAIAGGNRSSLPGRLLRAARELVHIGIPHRTGAVTIYNQDLKNLVDIPTASIDAVVAVSALEHNPPAELPQVVSELLRVLKPGGLLLATLCAGQSDWFHQPSQGWCYSQASLQQAFGFSQQVKTNYDEFDQLFIDLKNCAELRDNLAGFYKRSGDNGMPWGVWDPQYQPVGVCKQKQ